jgi:hypothetical protein
MAQQASRHGGVGGRQLKAPRCLGLIHSTLEQGGFKTASLDVPVLRQ